MNGRWPDPLPDRPVLHDRRQYPVPKLTRAIAAILRDIDPRDRYNT